MIEIAKKSRRQVTEDITKGGWGRGGWEKERMSNRRLILKSRLEIFLNNLLEVSQRG